MVQHGYGRLKGRWRCLLKQLDVDVSDVPEVVTACCVLHNICEVHGEKFSEEWLGVNQASVVLVRQPHLSLKIVMSALEMLSIHTTDSINMYTLAVNIGMYACNSSLIYSIELSAVYTVMLITSLVIKLILLCIVVVAVTLNILPNVLKSCSLSSRLFNSMSVCRRSSATVHVRCSVQILSLSSLVLPEQSSVVPS